MVTCIVVGTRPEIIKMSPLIKRLPDALFIHTGQHYSPEMDSVFFQDLGLRQPDVNLGVGSATHGEMTARIIKEWKKFC